MEKKRSMRIVGRMSDRASIGHRRPPPSLIDRHRSGYHATDNYRVRRYPPARYPFFPRHGPGKRARNLVAGCAKQHGGRRETTRHFSLSLSHSRSRLMRHQCGKRLPSDRRSYDIVTEVERTCRVRAVSPARIIPFGNDIARRNARIIAEIHSKVSAKRWIAIGRESCAAR